MVMMSHYVMLSACMIIYIANSDADGPSAVVTQHEQCGWEDAGAHHQTVQL